MRTYITAKVAKKEQFGVNIARIEATIDGEDYILDHDEIDISCHRLDNGERFFFDSRLKGTAIYCEYDMDNKDFAEIEAPERSNGDGGYYLNGKLDFLKKATSFVVSFEGGVIVTGSTSITFDDGNETWTVPNKIVHEEDGYIHTSPDEVEED